MPIICLEGASGVRKSSTCQMLQKHYNASIIPEVNMLFKRPLNASKSWYFERQVDRWQIAQEKQINNEIVVLDGDIFQPLWYNWSYDFQIYGQSLEFIENFYHAEIKNGNIYFPDGYFLLFTDTTELRRRKENDLNRSRSNFEEHLLMIEPQKRYFEFMNKDVSTYVKLIRANTIEANVRSIIRETSDFNPSENPSFSLDKFRKITEWLSMNKANGLDI